jgi:hypothetical protein
MKVLAVDVVVPDKFEVFVVVELVFVVEDAAFFEAASCIDAPNAPFLVELNQQAECVNNEFKKRHLKGELLVEESDMTR